MYFIDLTENTKLFQAFSSLLHSFDSLSKNFAGFYILISFLWIPLDAEKKPREYPT